jgi:flagellar biosynthesis protein FlhG
MLDQATELRKLVLRSVREPMRDESPPPQRLVVCGAAVGVGVTTLSVNLAVALSGQGWRVVLVDADWRRADVAVLCGLTPTAGITDVLAARRDIHEVLQPGPGGIQVVVGCERAGHSLDWGECAQQRLLRQLGRLGRHADLIVLDAGSGGHEVMRRLWRAANQVILVTTPETLAQTDSCAAFQRWVCKERPVSLRLLVNRVSDRSVAEEIQHRLKAAREDRGWNLELLGCVPSDPEIEAAGRTPTAGALWSRESPLTRALDSVATQLLAEKPQGGSVSRPQGALLADGLNPAVLTQPQPGFSPIDI